MIITIQQQQQAVHDVDDDDGASASFSCTFTYIFPRFCLAGARCYIAIDANIDDEHRTLESAQRKCLLCLPARACVCVSVCARRTVIGLVEDETCDFPRFDEVL